MLLCVSLYLVSLQNTPANANEILFEGIRNELLDQTLTDLSRVQRLAALTDAEVAEVITATDVSIKKAAKHFAPQAAEGLSRPAVMTPVVARVIESELRSHVSEAAGRKYAADVAERRQLWNDALLSGCVVMIDRRVGLTVKQAKEVRQVLQGQWPLSDQYSLGRMTRDLWAFDRHGKPGIIPVGFPTSAIYGLLSTPQKRAWDSWIDTLRQRDNPRWLKQLSEREAESVPQLARFLHHRALILSDQLELADKQRDRLILAAKGAARSAHQARRAAIAAFAADKRSPEHWEVIDTTTPDLAVCHSDWIRLVRRVLRDDDLERFNTLTKARSRAVHEAVARATAAKLSKRGGLLASEQRALYKLLAEGSVDPRGTWRSYSRYSQWCGLTNQRLARSFTGKQLQGIQVWLDRMSRQVLGQERSG